MGHIKAVGERIGAALYREWLAAAFASGALTTATTAAAVVDACCSSPHPPVGTPGARFGKGNSTPSDALVAGSDKSPAFSPAAGG